MEKGLEVVPTINMNIFIENYTNINNFHVDPLNFKQFKQENAKPEAKSRKVETPTHLETAAKVSTPLALPRIPSAQAIQSTEEPQTKPAAISTMRKQSELYEKREEVFENSNIVQIIGVFLIVFAAVLFIGVVYSVLISPLIGTTDHVLLDFIGSDSYYCCLAPLMIPASFIFIYANWVSIKFFRHT